MYLSCGSKSPEFNLECIIFLPLYLFFSTFHSSPLPHLARSSILSTAGCHGNLLPHPRSPTPSLLLLQYLRFIVVAWQQVTQCFLATGPPEGSANPEPLCISNPHIPPSLSASLSFYHLFPSSITRRLSPSHMLYLSNDSRYSNFIYLKSN